MKRSFCFDIDGTLLSTGGAGGRSFRKAVVALFGKEPDWKTIHMAGRLDPSIFNQILNSIQEPFSQQLWENFKVLYLDFLFQETTQLQNWKVYEGVFALLENLNQNQERPYLLTGNIKEGALLKLRAMKLEHFFDWEQSIFGDEGRENREELVIPLKHKHPGSLPIIIGDTPADILVGKLSGGISVAVSTGMHTSLELKAHSPDILVSSLSDLSLSMIELN